MAAATLADLLQQALALSNDDRLTLAEKLMDSVDAPTDAEMATITRRHEECLSGAAVMIPAEEALRQVRDMLAALRHA